MVSQGREKPHTEFFSGEVSQKEVFWKTKKGGYHEDGCWDDRLLK
jgi:hypothetical protein